MKSKQILSVFIVSSLLISVWSCSSNKVTKIENATYEIYRRGEERGFTVNFSVPNSTRPVAVVINQIEQPISGDARSGENYTVNVIAQTRRLLGYKVKHTDRENGIYFQKGFDTVFQPVQFRLINK